MVAYKRSEIHGRSGKWQWPLLFKYSLSTSRVEAIFIQQIFIEYLLCVRHFVDISVLALVSKTDKTPCFQGAYP